MSFSAQKLNGSCFPSKVRSGVRTNSMSCHILNCTALLCSGSGSAGGCKTRGGPQYPPPETFPFVNKGATFYGKNESFTFPRDDIYFDLSELESWDVIVNLAGQDFYSPRFANHSTYMRLLQRDQVHYPFEGIYDVEWTKADTTIYENDWLGNLMPGGWCYTSRGIPEPMLGSIYYEDSAKVENRPYILDKTKQSVRENWTPLCTPLNVYDKNGLMIGSFDGLCYSVFFNAAASKNPLRKRIYNQTTQTFEGDHPYGVLPLDKTLTYLDQDPPYLNPKREILSLEIWIYLSSSGGALKSPRIATYRWWHYTKGISYLDGGNYDSPFNPYMFLNTEDIPGFVNIPITFNLLKNSNNQEKLETKISNIRMYDFKIFIGA